MNVECHVSLVKEEKVFFFLIKGSYYSLTQTKHEHDTHYLLRLEILGLLPHWILINVHVTKREWVLVGPDPFKHGDIMLTNEYHVGLVKSVLGNPNEVAPYDNSTWN